MILIPPPCTVDYCMPTAMYSIYATGIHVTVPRMPVLQLYESLKSYYQLWEPIYFIVSAVRNQSISFQTEWLIVPDIISDSHIHRNLRVLLKVASGSINSKCIITRTRTTFLRWFNVAAAGIRLTLLIFSRQRHNAFSTLTRKDYIVCGAYLAYLQRLK